MIKEFLSLMQYFKKHSERFANHDYYNVLGTLKNDMSKFGLTDFNDIDILDLGAGQRIQLSLSLSSEGAVLTALDINYVDINHKFMSFAKNCKTVGFKRGVKTLVRSLLFDPDYYKRFSKLLGKNVYNLAKKVSFVQADPTASEYPIISEKFDLIVSIAVLEHVEDVRKYASEVKRLLKKGGYFYGIIHNYYSLSGGHRMEWAYPDEVENSHIVPWDHLLENKYPTHIYLNKLKPEEFLSIFQNELTIELFEARGITHKVNEREGEKFLTKLTKNRLSMYSEDQLLNRSYLLIGRKEG